MYTVYILYAASHNKTYVGFTSDLEQRLLSHNELGIKGWTIRFRPWILIHSEVYPTKTEAMARERALKSGKGRDWIRKELISKL